MTPIRLIASAVLDRFLSKSIEKSLQDFKGQLDERGYFFYEEDPEHREERRGWKSLLGAENWKTLKRIIVGTKKLHISLLSQQ